MELISVLPRKAGGMISLKIQVQQRSLRDLVAWVDTVLFQMIDGPLRERRGPSNKFDQHLEGVAETELELTFRGVGIAFAGDASERTACWSSVRIV